MSQSTAKSAKSAVISIRVAADRRDALEKAAIAAGASLSGFITDTMEKALSGPQKPVAVPVAPKPEAGSPKIEIGRISLSDPAALEELRRVGININQIARAANSQLPVSVVSLLEGLARLVEAMKQGDDFRPLADALRRAAVEAARAVTMPETVGESATANPAPLTAPEPPRGNSLLDRLGRLLEERNRS